eukprot:gnl/TRDRNA2_/TRDRNA2_196725_c0_seq1.p1 gnl/TRDRNA2_/TRDRNA2_196725_c0~~gnl/TRDRNA2_/TRDRNA2_196725_c0_seq1.p1  ORF type:complete len:405 (-),score=87.06 gnl/TRDRNA2_/TRDRNA2_196725_c0_seq1:25-1206(-)
MVSPTLTEPEEPSPQLHHGNAAVPAKALFHRLSASEQQPSWSWWLPEELRQRQASKLQSRDAGQWPDVQQTEVVATEYCMHKGLDESRSVCTQGHYAALPDPQVLSVLSWDAPTCWAPTEHLSAVSGGCREFQGGPSAPALSGYVWSLARDSKGTRTVQNEIDAADAHDKRLLASELRGHVLEALKCPHANFVIQKCITTMRPEDIQFIVDELKGTGVTAASHKYGCRIIERLLERCPAQQIEVLMREVIAKTHELCKHQFGNYVMQHLLQYGTEGQQKLVVEVLRDHVEEMVANPQSCAVVNKALWHCGLAMQRVLSEAVLAHDKLIVTLALARDGHKAVQRVLRSVEGEWREEASKQLHEGQDRLSGKRYAKAVLAMAASGPGHLEQEGAP